MYILREYVVPARNNNTIRVRRTLQHKAHEIQVVAAKKLPALDVVLAKPTPPGYYGVVKMEDQ